MPGSLLGGVDIEFITQWGGIEKLLFAIKLLELMIIEHLEKLTDFACTGVSQRRLNEDKMKIFKT